MFFHSGPFLVMLRSTIIFKVLIWKLERDPADIVNPINRLHEHTAGLMSIILSSYRKVCFSRVFFPSAIIKVKQRSRVWHMNLANERFLTESDSGRFSHLQDRLLSEAQGEKLHVSLLTTYRLLISTVLLHFSHLPKLHVHYSEIVLSFPERLKDETDSCVHTLVLVYYQETSRKKSLL